jgi:hypothetical protein
MTTQHRLHVINRALAAVVSIHACPKVKETSAPEGRKQKLGFRFPLPGGADDSCKHVTHGMNGGCQRKRPAMVLKDGDGKCAAP